MKVSRRTVLRLLASSLLVSGVPFRTGAEGPADAVFLALTGIGPKTPVSHLRAVVTPFLEREIPIGLVAGAEVWTDPALAEGIGRIIAQAPDSVEPVLSLPGIDGLPAYFQRRFASDAIGQMQRPAGAPFAPPPVTIATEASRLSNFDALRSLGIRNVLNLSPASAVTSAGCSERIVCLGGGRRLTLAAVPDPGRWIEGAFAGPGWSLILLSLDGIAGLTPAEAQARVWRLCDAIGHEIGAGRRFASLPREHARWFGADQLRVVAVRVEAGTAASADGLAALRTGMRALGLAATETVPLTADGTGAWPDGTCAALPGVGARAPETGSVVLPEGLRCLAMTSAQDRPPSRLATAADLLLVSGAAPALDGLGRFIRDEVEVPQAAALLKDGHRMRDAVLVVRPRDYAAPPARQATLDVLGRIRNDPGTRLVDVPTFFRATVTADPVFDLLHAVRRDTPDMSDPDALPEAELLADARQAWTFFEQFSIAQTGLCVATADVQEGGAWLHRELTMWDLGSLIAAVMAAHELGLIPDAEFIARADLMVRALPAGRIGDWTLPGEVISSDTGAVLSQNFNACDTGRLLSLLRSLDAHPMTRGIAEEQIAHWDLAAVVERGHVHSVVDGRRVDRFRSHCSHYTARAFRERGIEAQSPYEVAGTAGTTDHDMRLLLALAGLGPLGAEPLLLEAVELGLSGPSRVLADILFAAQRQEHERSGTLVCMSEAPLNIEPWFTYQGLDVASSEHRWVTNVASSEARFNTPAFRQGVWLVNTKAAYLWAATHPSSYATLLARHVRARARLDGIGFAPGVHVATGLGMPGYADLNTNGIVLQAIAYILRGRVPLPRT